MEENYQRNFWIPVLGGKTTENSSSRINCSRRAIDDHDHHYDDDDQNHTILYSVHNSAVYKVRWLMIVL